jgi:hypothetical protein
VRSFGDLVDEAASVDVSGWAFDWFDGRATEQRPPWRYSRLLASRLPRALAALDIDTGGGEIIAEMPQLPPRTVVTAVDRYREPLHRLDAHIRAHGAFVAHCTRTLVEARRSPR